MRYPVILTPDICGFFASIPDIPEALTQGDNYEHALEMAQDVLESSLDFYFDDEPQYLCHPNWLKGRLT